MLLELEDISISDNDPCLALLEQNLQSGIDTLLPNGGWRRYQTLIIMRQGWDVPRAFKRDMGPMENFTATEFHLCGGMIHLKDGTEMMVPKVMPDFDRIRKIEIFETVGPMLADADDARGGALTPPEHEPMDIWTEFFTQREQQDQYKKEHIRTLGQIVDDILWKQREGII